MTCCSNQKKTCTKETMAVDIKTLLTLAEEYATVAPKLLEIARSGIRCVDFKNPNINELAATLSAIVAENQYLKNLLGIFHPGKAAVEDNGVTISFGPGNTSLIAAADELKKVPPASPEQKWLPFVDCA